MEKVNGRNVRASLDPRFGLPSIETLSPQVHERASLSAVARSLKLRVPKRRVEIQR